MTKCPTISGEIKHILPLHCNHITLFDIGSYFSSIVSFISLNHCNVLHFQHIIINQMKESFTSSFAIFHHPIDWPRISLAWFFVVVVVVVKKQKQQLQTYYHPLMFDYIRSKHNIIPEGKLRRKYLRKSHDVVEYRVTSYIWWWPYLPYVYGYIIIVCVCSGGILCFGI